MKQAFRLLRPGPGGAPGRTRVAGPAAAQQIYLSQGITLVQDADRRV
jgi:hypothetical protein